MNLDQLRDSLSGNEPRPSDVLNTMRRKQRNARNRMYAASGGLAVVAVAIVAGVLLRGVSLGIASSSSSSSAASGSMAQSAPAAASGPVTSSGSAAAGNATVPAPVAGGAAGSCADVTLRQEIAYAVQAGGSVIVGYGTPSGKSVPAAASAGGGTYEAVTLRSVQTLAGPAIRPGSTAWILAASQAGSSGSASSPEGQTLWARDGQLFAIASPAAAAGNAPVGPVLRSAPVISGQVIFSASQCWSVAGLPATRYSGPDSVFGTSGSQSLNEAPGAPGTRYAVPLAAVERIARQH